MSERQEKDGWDKLIALSTLLGATLVPISLAVLGISINWSSKTKELDAKMVEISLNILSKTPNEENKNIRQWAIKTIDFHSVIPLEKNVEDYFANNSYSKSNDGSVIIYTKMYKCPANDSILFIGSELENYDILTKEEINKNNMLKYYEKIVEDKACYLRSIQNNNIHRTKAKLCDGFYMDREYYVDYFVTNTNEGNCNVFMSPD